MKGTLKILSLEDQEDDFYLIVHALRKSGMDFEARRVDSKEDFSNALDEFGADLILCDHSLPQFNSNEALRIFHQRKLQIPFILVTGAVSEEFAVSSLKHGADDYVLKSNLTRLPNVIENALKQKEAERQKTPVGAEGRGGEHAAVPGDAGAAAGEEEGAGKVAHTMSGMKRSMVAAAWPITSR